MLGVGRERGRSKIKGRYGRCICMFRANSTLVSIRTTAASAAPKNRESGGRIAGAAVAGKEGNQRPVQESSWRVGGMEEELGGSWEEWRNGGEEWDCYGTAMGEDMVVVPAGEVETSLIKLRLLLCTPPQVLRTVYCVMVRYRWPGP